MKSKPIDRQLLKSWRNRMWETTYKEIAEQTGLSVHTIGNTLRTGIATPDTITKLTNHFNQIPA